MTEKYFRPKCWNGWTKQQVFHQLSIFDDDNGLEIKPPFKVTDLHDSDVQEWVEQEWTLRDDFPSEEQYVRNVAALNEDLVLTTCKRLKKRK